MKSKFKLLILLMGFSNAAPAILTDSSVYLMPRNCTELLPDPGPFVDYFKAVGIGLAKTEPRLAKKIFKIRGFRNKLDNFVDLSKQENPVDIYIRKTLCFYRSQRDPISPIPFDDKEFISYLRKALPEVERKVETIVLHVELARQKRLAYERQLNNNRILIEKLEEQGDKEAELSFKRLSKEAVRQLKK